MKNPEQLQQALRALFPANQFYTDPSDCWVYGYDNSRRHALPDAVIFALSHEDIVKTTCFCYEQGIPLIARGRASGTTGGTVPIDGGIVLSLERMQRILQIDPANRTMTVEAGVLNATVQQEAKQYGFFWAPDPTSAPYCSVGGNLACNAAGPRSLKYGTTRDNVLGLTAVIGTGETIHCGAVTSKSAMAYDLTRLMIGSEGTLGIISQAILKLLPLPESKRTLRLLYQDNHAAAEAIIHIMSQPITPCGLEFLDNQALQLIRQTCPAEDLPPEAGSLLIVELDGTEDTLQHALTCIQKAAQHPQLVDCTVATTPEAVEKLWSIRKSLSQTLRRLSPHKINEDVVVPLSHIPTLLDYTHHLAKEYNITIVNFGHAGNGNLHVNLLIDPLDPIDGPRAQQCLQQLFEKVLTLQGCLSGEHGIGLEKREYIHQAIDPPTLQLMKKIKMQCDPKGILNPGKIFE